ncbi:aryl-sulfate sulfotransferase, partial [Oscillibacter sp.]|uniref:aryl-sulfate sulfotransferase n=1 Tax=Oscillibacter sp. TaxID=1945593 RepID=UPI0028A10EAE
MLKRISACFLAMLLLVSLVSPAAAAARSAADWTIVINRITLAAELDTDEVKTAYDGSTYIENHHDEPSAGMCFAVVTLSASKNSWSADALNYSDFQLLDQSLNGFSGLADSRFLSAHNYSPISAGQITTSVSGSICFEIPESYLGATPDGWTASCGGYTSGYYYASAVANVPKVSMEIAQQEEREDALLTQYALLGDVTLENAMVVQDVYGNAPLSAVALFETAESCTVTVTVQGKTENADITYPVAGADTHHEVPIFGLYAGYDNTVTIALSTGESHDFTVTTAAVPTWLDTVTPNASNDVTKIADGQLYFLHDPYRMIFDRNGDIRWYASQKFYLQICSDSSTLNADASGFWFGYHSVTASANDSCTEVANMNWIGKFSALFSYEDYIASHDGTLLSNGHFLYFGQDTVLCDIDPQTGELTEYLDFADVLDPSKGNLNLEGGDPPPAVDWAHSNNVEYVAANNSLLVSLRNQHMILDIDYDTKEILWVMTVASWRDSQTSEIYATQPSAAPFAVLPAEGDTDFEWFFSQHDPTFISYDAENQIFDFVLFDNGSVRYLPGETPNNDRYSRIVRYSVDIPNRTAAQTFQYGKEEGERLYSIAYGSAALVEQSGNYLGNFRCHNNEESSSIVTEVDDQKNVIAEFAIDCSAYFYGSYRVNALFLQENSFSNCGFLETPGLEYHRYNQTRWNSTTLPSQSSGSFSAFSVASLTTDGETVSLYGTAMIANSTYTPKIELVAVDAGGRAFSYNMGVSRASTGAFYGKGIPLDTLNSGVYQLYIRSTNGAGNAAWKFTGYQLTVGASYDPVTDTDELSWQAEIDRDLQATFQRGSYDLANPYVAVDPYDLSPLSAYILFTTAKPATISATVKSKPGANDISHDFTDLTDTHTIPIYGLYPEEATDVVLTAHYADGTSERSTVSVTGRALPLNMLSATVSTAQQSKMADGLTLIISGNAMNYSFAIDANGDTRWTFSQLDIAQVCGITVLQNGHLLASGQGHTGAYYKYGLLEMDLTGKIYKEYMLDGVHHDVLEEPNGNLLVLGNDPDGVTVEDTVYELDRETGAILRIWDLNSYFNVSNTNESGAHIADVNYGSGATDWFHNNSIEYSPADNSMILSGRQQDAVIKISLTTGELVWILSDPNDSWTADQRAKLLTPVGEGFAWQYGQHCAKLASNGDLMLFDNGDYRSKTAEGIVPATQGYSRVVFYRIDETNHTVRQISQFGKEMGSETLAAYVGGEQELGENHYLAHFGGIIKNAAGDATYNIMEGITGSSATRIYEVSGGEVVFQAGITAKGLNANTFRSLRINPFTCANETALGGGVRVSGLMRRGAAEIAALPAGFASFTAENLVVTDDGRHLTLSAETVTGGDMTLYLVGSVTYRVPVTVKDGAVSLTLSDSELPAGAYDLYLVSGSAQCNLKTTWTNAADYRAVPASHQITAVSADASMGSAFGSGTYYDGTALTVTAIPNSGYTFTGWQINGAQASTSLKFSFVPTGDATLTAVFQSSASPDVPSGGGGGGAVGGGGGAAVGAPSTPT